ncbi:MAG: hypothetical protein QOK02_200 [Mycobacterium sp.]|nr:hypothetical protein [Mycobacterium sp.]
MRRRLLVFSAPVVIAVIVVLVKLWSVVIAGSAVPNDFATKDTAALRQDVAALDVINVIEPEKASFAAGALAVLDDRLSDAEAHFSAASAETDPGESCPALVNLELVRETLGDRAATASDAETASRRYRGALETIARAPSGCFAGSTDPDSRRRAVLDSAARRVNDKINALASHAPPPPPPPQLAPPPPPPPPPSPSSADTTTAPDQQLRLNPGAGDPLDRLRQILRDAAAAAPSDG